jgi:ETRAMP family membrane protein|tara:strand:- start:100 stop:537 length:438 start_codon:yes stop_codon:yes gene_type:complete
MALSKEEIREIRHENQKTESNIEKNTIEKPKNNKKIIIVSIVSVIFILIVGSVGFSYYNYKKPFILDEFAQCLKDKGAVMFGSSTCQYTTGQHGMFGPSKKFLDSRDFTEDKNIKITPTWLINGLYYENAQSLQTLADLTDCELP